MAGDYSRKTFTRANHYSGVLMQQGRVQLDADWNEQGDIVRYRTETETIDVIGTAGAPKSLNSNFKIGLLPKTTNQPGPVTDLSIAPGRMYVDGLLCELDQPATYLGQPYQPAPDRNFFGPLPVSPPLSPPASPPASPVSLRDGTYLVYLNVWEREINFRDNPRIHEVALGEADTTTRQQTVWQVKLLKVANTSPPVAATCEMVFPEWDAITEPMTGQLAVQTRRSEDVKDPCALPPTTGFRRLENQFYRVEVHQGGTLGGGSGTQPTFVWSRDNASVETSITAIDGANVIVADLGRDTTVLGFAPGQWVEILDDVSTLTNQPNQLLKIEMIDTDTRRITLSGSVDTLKSRSGLKLRRWDQSEASVPVNPVASDWLDLEDGIQVSFSPGTFRPGDYWMFAARTATGDVEWPQTNTLATSPIPQLPAGVSHHYARLALLNIRGGIASPGENPSDCRKQFPPLTAITASDVIFDNTNCQLPQAKTVQQALDILCRSRQGGCTITAVPGPGWETKVLAQLEQIKSAHNPIDTTGKDAQICFPVGEFPLTRPLEITGMGHLKLNGAGSGTQILAPGLEKGLVFGACESVLIRDLYVETSHENSKSERDGTQFLNGALTFLNCTAVDVEQVDLKCGTGFGRTATCLTVRHDDSNSGSVRIRHCDLLVGHQQQGILLVNVRTATVSDNTLNTYRTLKPGTDAFDRLLDDHDGRASIRHLLFDEINPSEQIPQQNIVKFDFENISVTFGTHQSLVKAWASVLRRTHPNEGSSKTAVLAHIKELAERFLTDKEFLNSRVHLPFKNLIDSVARSVQDVAAQGITIGGEQAGDIRVLNNSIAGSMQGVHIGLSHRDAEATDFDVAGVVTVAGNTIAIVLPAWASNQDRYGIFVGHCQSLLIENNTLQLARLAGAGDLSIDGIRVWGQLGERLMITKNYAASIDKKRSTSFWNGIHVNAFGDNMPDTAQWAAIWNVAPSQNKTVEDPNGTIIEENNRPV